MKRFYLGLIAFIIFFKVSGQKPILDTAVFREWPLIESGQISSDGKYISYNICYKSYLRVKRRVLVLQSVSGKWERKLLGATSEIRFSLDCKKGIVKVSKDSLAIIDLGSDRVRYIPKIVRYQATPEYVFYTTSDDSYLLNVLSLGSNTNFSINNITKYIYDKEKNSLILTKKVDDGTTILSCFDLRNRTNVDLWRGLGLDNITLDHHLGQIAFTGEKNGIGGVWLYTKSNNDVQLLLKGYQLEADSLYLSGIGSFSSDDKKLFLIYGKRNNHISKKIDSTSADVSIWNYADVRLKSQHDDVRSSNELNYVVNLITKKTFPITGENQVLLDCAGDFAIIEQYPGKGDPDDEYWKSEFQNKKFLISLNDGSSVELPMKNPIFSRGGSYLLYYNYENEDYYTYEIGSGKLINLTQGVRELNKNSFHRNVKEFIESTGYRSFWLDNDSALILCAERDIWIFDPHGFRDPVNITNGYGVKNDISFYPLEDFSKFSFQNGEKLVLMGFSYTNKDNGFYRIRMGEKKDPQVLTMDSHVYYVPYLPIENGFNSRPIKARNSNTWLVRKMSEKESPNLFVTNDFKKFLPVTNIFPEKRYNWMTTELHTWQSFNGITLQGILYKPENFDPNRKYPIIFHYYDQWSRNLHAYLIPGPSIGPINIPWYVSQGYLVFVPDVFFNVGETGACAFNSIVSAASYMKTKDYVDSSKMAIQGHSFGGYETNYIITQTDIFAAACSSSGVTDIVSFAGALGASGKSNHLMASKGQLGMGEILWSNPDRFIKNSPLFSLDRVTTPLLAMHTTEDRAVPLSQAMELFTGLRLFKKRVWLLVYQGEDHILRSEKNSLDYTLRQTGFFNYYLKNAVMPEWMKPSDN